VVSQHDAVGLGIFDSELRSYVPPKASNAAIRNITEQLERVVPEPPTDVAGILRQFQARLRRRSYVILISDLLDGTDAFLKGLENLRTAGHNVMVLQVLDPHEREFPFHGTCRFEGLEGETPLLLNSDKVRDAYLQELEHFLEHIRVHCTGAAVDYHLLDTGTDLADSLTSVLKLRGR
jgi:uncharacterized protein (DUF58 family)